MTGSGASRRALHGFVRLAAGLLSALPLAQQCTAQSAAAVASQGFVAAEGTRFVVDGRPFYVTGVNNHYLTFGSEAEVMRVLDDAVALGASVVRTFVQPIIGSPDGAGMATIWNFRAKADSSDLGSNGSYIAFWDTAQKQMGINTGANGLGKLDFLLAEAKKRNLRLIIALADFWAYTGGAQQMRAWYGSADENQFFFTDPRSIADYKSLAATILTRRNPLTGIDYRDDPTIFAWELMNEPYAKPDALFVAWTSDMSAYIKSIDPKHLVASGHANVYNRMSDLAIATIDFGTWHGYPLYYNLTPSAFDAQISAFCALAARHGKPVLLEEFGYARSNKDQLESYARWLTTLERDQNCAGWLVWRLVSRQDSGYYPRDEHDQFDVHRESGPLWHLLQKAAGRAASKY